MTLFNRPFCSVLGVLDGDAEGFKVISDAVAECPILGILRCLPLLKHHIHQTVDCLSGLAIVPSLIFEPKYSIDHIIEDTDQCLNVPLRKGTFFLLLNVYEPHCIENMGQCNRRVPIVTKRLISLSENILHILSRCRASIRSDICNKFTISHLICLMPFCADNWRDNPGGIGNGPEIAGSLHYSLVSFLCGLQSLIREVKCAAIMSL